MENQSPHLSLRVPTPTQQNLSFCDATPKDIKYWLAHLPKANLWGGDCFDTCQKRDG